MIALFLEGAGGFSLFVGLLVFAGKNMNREARGEWAWAAWMVYLSILAVAVGLLAFGILVLAVKGWTTQ